MKTQTQTHLKTRIPTSKTMQPIKCSKAQDPPKILLDVWKNFLDPGAVELLSNAGILTLPLTPVRTLFTVAVAKTETTSSHRRNVKIIVTLSSHRREFFFIFYGKTTTTKRPPHSDLCSDPSSFLFIATTIYYSVNQPDCVKVPISEKQRDSA